MTTNLYVFDLQNGVYLGSRPAQTRPNGAPITDCIGATPIAPPEMEAGFVAVWNGSTWELKEDHRGEAGWLNGRPHTISGLGPLPDGFSSEAPKPTPEETAREVAALAAAKSARILTARLQREMVQTAEFTPAEFSLFATAGLFPEWAADTEYAVGARIAHKRIVYAVQQTHTAQSHQPPDSAGMLALYRPLCTRGSGEDGGDNNPPDGSRERPYAFIPGMDVYADNYYTHADALYLAKADMLPCVWPPDTPGLWQWEAVEAVEAVEQNA